MKAEYRVIFTSTHETAAERDKVAEWIKGKVATLQSAATFKRADITKDEYQVPDTTPTSEKIIG